MKKNEVSALLALKVGFWQLSFPMDKQSLSIFKLEEQPYYYGFFIIDSFKSRAEISVESRPSYLFAY